ncbi:spinocerebellar ataxia type 10 protein domain-containing protein [Trametes polyzona]|nr:spinocerebellar ataxia type 10 protein domain-containing protein [Trametes polyzona]
MCDPTSDAPHPDVRRIHRAAEGSDPDIAERVRALTDILDEYAPTLAANDQARRNIGNATNPSIWSCLRALWRATADAHADPDQDDAPRLIRLSVSLARFTRNLVAASPTNQQRAFAYEKEIRSLIYHYTSFNATQDANTFPATRMLSQTLSNIVTGNDELAQALWTAYLNLPEEQLVLTRLFASPDPRTVSSAFVLVLNCVHDNARRAEQLVNSPRGPRICITMLDRIATLFEADETSEEGRAFDIGCEIFGRVIEEGLAAELFTRLAVEGEVITPHQTTLLKLIDSHLHGSQHAHAIALSGRQVTDGRSPLFDVLTRAFFALSTHVQDAIQRAIGPGRVPPAQVEGGSYPPPGSGHGSDSSEPPPLQNLDLLLPKVCEALVLVSQCLTTVALRAEEAAGQQPGGSVSPLEEAGAQATPKELLVAATNESGQGLVESLIETLRLIDAFVPRITYGKVVKRPAPPDGIEALGRSEEAPSDANSSTSTNMGTGRGATIGGADSSGSLLTEDARAAQGFAHVKRDLVRLLGILASDNRTVQDRARLCGGIPVVMNLCVVDDYNPYLREHAIFALRNLLHKNAENQAVVDAIKPVGKWDEEKVLRDIRS